MSWETINNTGKIQANYKRGSRPVIKRRKTKPLTKYGLQLLKKAA
jgi:DNA/RNA endonuclease YhcR with UshA esterase domain